jgi:rhamnosyltransferase
MTPKPHLVKKEIMVVIVSFNGGNKIIKTIDALVDHVGHIHIVDNASDKETVSVLKKLSSEQNISISWLDENTGLGHALNIGVQRAQVLGFNWLLTMDQDSVVHTTMIQTYIAAINQTPSIKCLTPNYQEHDQVTGSKILKVNYAITSGNLVQMKVFDKIGIYNEDLFIDGVDFDFSLRVRSAGWNIYYITGAYMNHELGHKPCTLPILGRLHTYHSPIRRYYIFRNYFYLSQEYIFKFPNFVIKSTFAHLGSVITILILGERRLASIKYILRGFVDYVRNHKGSI